MRKGRGDGNKYRLKLTRSGLVKEMGEKLF